MKPLSDERAIVVVDSVVSSNGDVDGADDDKDTV